MVIKTEKESRGLKANFTASFLLHSQIEQPDSSSLADLVTTVDLSVSSRKHFRKTPLILPLFPCTPVRGKKMLVLEIGKRGKKYN